MAKTSREIQGDIFELLLNSDIPNEINGAVYRQGYRPRDSRKEDCIVIFTAGMADQIQTGVITLHIYVPDIELGNICVEDGAKTEYFERVLQNFVDGLKCKTNYKFKLQQTIKTEAEPSIQQHFVVAALKYEYFDEN